MAAICLMNSGATHPRDRGTRTSAFKLPTNRVSCSRSNLQPIVVTGNPPSVVSAPNRRIVAVGDLHGDLSKARFALNMAGVLGYSDGQDLWIGGETVLVQLGDVLDRGEDEIAILSLLRSLDAQARAQGGAVFQVNGNHETMNVEGDFRYVDSRAYDECADFLYFSDNYHDWDKAFIDWIDVSARWKEERITSRSKWGPWDLVKKQKGMFARSILFKQGGQLARELARHGVVLKVNDWIFCHGGLLPHHAVYGIERLNREVSDWMKGLSEETGGMPHIPFIATRGYDSVVWSRLYSRDVSDLEDYQIDQIHSILEETLQTVGAKGMVVGHTPQTQGVNCEYNCSIWRVDVGMSSGVLDSRPEVLEIVDGNARPIRSEVGPSSELKVLSYV